MSSKILFALVAGAVLAASPAFAREEAKIKLSAPLAGAEKVIADSAVWACEGDSCATVLRKKPTVRGCADVAKEFGPVVSYGYEGGELTADELARCNAKAKPVATAVAETAPAQ